MIAQTALRHAIETLRGAGVPDPVADARRLMAFTLKVGGAGLTPHLNEPMSSDKLAVFQAVIKRRAARVPLTQITGIAAFMGHEFRVTEDTLSPRPETETLVEAVLERAPRFERIVDLGTGTGCILISLLLANPKATGLGTDISAAAVDVAKGNAESLGVSSRSEFVCTDWGHGVDLKADVIVSNPPYIAETERLMLEEEVRCHEPEFALFAGDGVDAYRKIIPLAHKSLTQNGWLFLECAAPQAEGLCELASSCGFAKAEAINDLSGRPRVVVARR